MDLFIPKKYQVKDLKEFKSINVIVYAGYDSPDTLQLKEIHYINIHQ